MKGKRRIAYYNEVQRLHDEVWPEESWKLKADYVVVRDEVDEGESKVHVEAGVSSMGDALLLIHGETLVKSLRNIIENRDNGVLFDSDFSEVKEILNEIIDVTSCKKRS